MGKEDLQIIKQLMDKKRWDRSRAVRHVIRLIGVILQRGELSNIEEILEEEELQIPDKCTQCGSDFIIKGQVEKYLAGSYYELWECENYHVFRIVYRPVSFVQLLEK